MAKNNFKGSTVDVIDGNFEKAFRVFQRKINGSGILKEIRYRSEFVKPSDIKIEKKKEAVKKWRKYLRTTTPQKS